MDDETRTRRCSLEPSMNVAAKASATAWSSRSSTRHLTPSGGSSTPNSSVNPAMTTPSSVSTTSHSPSTTPKSAVALSGSSTPSEAKSSAPANSSGEMPASLSASTPTTSTIALATHLVCVWSRGTPSPDSFNEATASFNDPARASTYASASPPCVPSPYAAGVVSSSSSPQAPNSKPTATITRMCLTRAGTLLAFGPPPRLRLKSVESTRSFAQPTDQTARAPSHRRIWPAAGGPRPADRQHSTTRRGIGRDDPRDRSGGRLGSGQGFADWV